MRLLLLIISFFLFCYGCKKENPIVYAQDLKEPLCPPPDEYRVIGKLIDKQTGLPVPYHISGNGFDTPFICSDSLGNYSYLPYFNTPASGCITLNHISFTSRSGQDYFLDTLIPLDTLIVGIPTEVDIHLQAFPRTAIWLQFIDSTSNGSQVKLAPHQGGSCFHWNSTNNPDTVSFSNFQDTTLLYSCPATTVNVAFKKNDYLDYEFPTAIEGDTITHTIILRD